jgi:hypothetical protein
VELNLTTTASFPFNIKQKDLELETGKCLGKRSHGFWRFEPAKKGIAVQIFGNYRFYCAREELLTKRRGLPGAVLPYLHFPS